MSEERIYVVVAETVDTPNGVVIQPCGRAMAQACHVVSRMRARHHQAGSIFAPITTIILAGRDQRELQHVIGLLDRDQIARECFYDTNEEVYGSGDVMTSICTWPIDPVQTIGVLDYLPLWSHR